MFVFRVVLAAVKSSTLRRRSVEMVTIGLLFFGCVHFGIRTSSNSVRSDRSTSDVQRLDQPSLTLCTTFSDNPDRHVIHVQTVHNWAALRPQLRPVLFTANMSSSLSVLAQKHGWQIESIKEADAQGMPFINAMFQHIEAKYKSFFYGYANGDMLFSRSLTDTMTVMPRLTKRKSKPYLFVGQRRSVNYKEMLKQDAEFWRPDSVHKYSCAKGHIDPPTTIDFFITTPYGFPWATLPKLVVGKTRFDNYIIMMAIYLFVGTVDVTGTVHNLHMTAGGGHMTHKDSGLTDQRANERTINSFGAVTFELGSVANCKYFTRRTKDGLQMVRLLQWKIPASFRRLQLNAKRLMVQTV